MSVVAKKVNESLEKTNRIDGDDDDAIEKVGQGYFS